MDSQTRPEADNTPNSTQSTFDGLASGYDRFVRPLEKLIFARFRRRMIPLAEGRILELAIGTGANLPLYPHGACIVGLDISREMLGWARRRRHESCALLLQADASGLPFPDACFDTVVSTLLYCSLDDPARALKEMYRVLRPEGKLLMLEHGRAPSRLLGPLIDLINIPWHALSRSCRLTREPIQDLPLAGFVLLATEMHFAGIVQYIVARPVKAAKGKQKDGAPDPAS